MVDSRNAGGGVKIVRVDGGGAGVVIDIERECRAIDYVGSGGGGDYGYDSCVDGVRASDCGRSGVHVVGIEHWEEGWERRCLGVVGGCAGDTILVIFGRDRREV